MQIIYTNDFIYNSVLAEKGIKFVIRGYCFVKDNKKWLHRIFTKDINAFKDISLEDLEDNCQLITSQKKTGEDVLNDLFDVSFTPTLEMTTPNLRVETGEFVEHEDPNAPEEKIYTTKYGGEAFGEYRFRINSGLNNNTLKGIEGTYRAIALIGEKYTEDEKYMVSQNKSYLAMVIYFDGAQNKDKCPGEDTNGLTVTDDTAFTIHFQFALSELDYLDNSYVDPKQHIEMDLDKDYKKLITQFNQQDQTTIKWETPGIFLTPKGKEYSHRVNLEEPNMREQHEEISYFDKNILLIPESDRNNNIFNITTKFMIFDDHKDNFVHPQMLLSYGGTESAISSVFVPQSIAFEYDPKYFALNEKAPTGHTRFDVFGGRTKKEVTGYDDKKFDKMNGYLRMLSDGGEHFGGNDSTFFMSKDNSAKTTFSDLWISDKNQISSNNTVVVDSRMNSINQVNNGFIVDAEVSNFAGQDGLTVFSTYKSSAASSLPNYDPKKNDPYLCPDCNGTGKANTDAIELDSTVPTHSGWHVFQVKTATKDAVKELVEKNPSLYYDDYTFTFFVSSGDVKRLIVLYGNQYYDCCDLTDYTLLNLRGIIIGYDSQIAWKQGNFIVRASNQDVKLGNILLTKDVTYTVKYKRITGDWPEVKCKRCSGDGRIGAYGYPGNNIHIGLNTSSMDFNGYNNTFIGFKGLFSNFGHDAVVFGDHNACGNKEYDMCETCHGDGRVQCTACCFDPETEPAMSLVTSPENWNPFGQVPAKELVMCPECQGYGKAPKSHVRCDMCNGTQYIDDKKTIPCVRCGQTGQLYVTSMSAIYPCDSCTPLDKDGFKYSGASGTGLVESDNVIWSACPECSGYGRSMCLDCSGAGFLENYEHALRTSGCATCRKPLETDYGNMTEGVTGLLTICPACSAWANRCPICDGTGELNGNRCWNCEGVGTTPRGYDICDVCKGDGKLEDNSSCPTCSGTGHSRTCELCEGDKQICAACGGDGLVECEYCTDMPGTNDNNTVLNSYVYDFALFDAAGKPKYKVIREVDTKNAQGVVTVPAGEYDIVAFMWYNVKENKNHTYEGNVAKVFRATNGVLIVDSEDASKGWGLTICFKLNGNLYPNYPVQYYQGSKERAGIRDNKTGKKFETINDFLDAALVKTNTKNSFSRGFVPCFECNNNYLEDTEDCPWCNGRGRLYGKNTNWAKRPNYMYGKWLNVTSGAALDYKSNVSLSGDDKYDSLPWSVLNQMYGETTMPDCIPWQSNAVSAVIGKDNLEKDVANFNFNLLNINGGKLDGKKAFCVMCNGRGYIDGVFCKCNACDGSGLENVTSNGYYWWIDCMHCGDVSNVFKNNVNLPKTFSNYYSKILNTFKKDNSIEANMPAIRGKHKKNMNTPFGLHECSLCRGVGSLAADDNTAWKPTFYLTMSPIRRLAYISDIDVMHEAKDLTYNEYDTNLCIIEDSVVTYPDVTYTYPGPTSSGNDIFFNRDEVKAFRYKSSAETIEGKTVYKYTKEMLSCVPDAHGSTDDPTKWTITIKSGHSQEPIIYDFYYKATYTVKFLTDEEVKTTKIVKTKIDYDGDEDILYYSSDNPDINGKAVYVISDDQNMYSCIEGNTLQYTFCEFWWAIWKNNIIDNYPNLQKADDPLYRLFEWFYVPKYINDHYGSIKVGLAYCSSRAIEKWCWYAPDAHKPYYIDGNICYFADLVKLIDNNKGIFPLYTKTEKTNYLRDYFTDIFGEELGSYYSEQWSALKWSNTNNNVMCPNCYNFKYYSTVQNNPFGPSLKYPKNKVDELLLLSDATDAPNWEDCGYVDPLEYYFYEDEEHNIVNQYEVNRFVSLLSNWGESQTTTAGPLTPALTEVGKKWPSYMQAAIITYITNAIGDKTVYKNTFAASHNYSLNEMSNNTYFSEYGYESFCDACNPNATPQIYLFKGKSVEPDKQGKIEEGAVKVAGIIDCPDCGNDGAPPGEHICESCLGAKHWYCNTCKGDGEVEYRPTVAYEDGKVMAVGDGYFYKNLFSKPVSTFDMYKDYVNIRPDENCDIGRGEYLKRMNLFSVENNGLLVIHNNNYDDIPTSDVKRNYNKDFFAVRSWAKYDSLSDRFANLQNCCYATDGIYFPKRTTHNEEWKLRLKELQYLITDSYIKTNASMLKTTALNQAIADFYKNNTTYLLKLGPIISYAIKGVWKKGAKGSKGVKGMTKGTKGKKGMKGLKGLKGTKGAKGYYEKIVVTNKRYKYTLADILAAVKAEYGQTILDSGNLGKDTRTYTFYCLNEDSENSLYFKGVRIRKGRNGNYQTLNAVKGCKPYSIQRLVYKNNGYNGEYGIMNFNYSWNREFLT